MSKVPEYRLERIFNAPCELVWRAWTDPEFLHQWYGPNVETIIHAFDLKAGGNWRNEMKWGSKSDFSTMTFLEVVKLKKLVWRQSSTDANWNVTSNPMMPSWPRTVLTTVTFTDRGDNTAVLLTQAPVDATEAELACFAKFMARMDNGWGSGYAIMDKLLVDLQASAGNG